jgi:hypothetical protein
VENHAENVARSPPGEIKDKRVVKLQPFHRAVPQRDTEDLPSGENITYTPGLQVYLFMSSRNETGEREIILHQHAN